MSSQIAETKKTMRKVKLDGSSEIVYQCEGDGNELIVFIHAVGGDHTSWASQIDFFKAKYTCAALDLRGHGLSNLDAEASVDEACTIQHYAKDVLAVIKDTGFLRAHLVGLSMGGVVALSTFEQCKDAVQSMTPCKYLERCGRSR